MTLNIISLVLGLALGYVYGPRVKAAIDNYLAKRASLDEDAE